MTMRNADGPAMSSAGSRPRRAIATLDTYADAQRAVDRLSNAGFPVERVAIVGTGLRYVEQVTGRFTTGQAAMAGAVQGAILGALFGLTFGLVFTIDPATTTVLLMLYGVVAGAVLGAVLGALTHAGTGGGDRDFSSVPAIQADRYEIVVDEDAADRAAEIVRPLRPGARP
jgi:hypothetical protein